MSVRVQSSSTLATRTWSAMPNVRSTSENRSPPSMASEPTRAPATTRSSSSASPSRRSRRASRCSTVNTEVRSGLQLSRPGEPVEDRCASVRARCSEGHDEVLQRAGVLQATGRYGFVPGIADQPLRGLSGLGVAAPHLAGPDPLRGDVLVRGGEVQIERFGDRAVGHRLDLVRERRVRLVPPGERVRSVDGHLAFEPRDLRERDVGGRGIPPVTAEGHHLVAGLLPHAGQAPTYVSPSKDGDAHPEPPFVRFFNQATYSSGTNDGDVPMAEGVEPGSIPDL